MVGGSKRLDLFGNGIMRWTSQLRRMKSRGIPRLFADILLAYARSGGSSGWTNGPVSG